MKTKREILVVTQSLIGFGNIEQSSSHSDSIKDYLTIPELIMPNLSFDIKATLPVSDFKYFNFLYNSYHETELLGIDKENIDLLADTLRLSEYKGDSRRRDTVKLMGERSHYKMKAYTTQGLTIDFETTVLKQKEGLTRILREENPGFLSVHNINMYVGSQSLIQNSILQKYFKELRSKSDSEITRGVINLNNFKGEVLVVKGPEAVVYDKILGHWKLK